MNRGKNHKSKSPQVKRTEGVGLSFVFPTRNRPDRVEHTLRKLASLRIPQGEVVIIDNASDQPIDAPSELSNGLPVRIIRLDSNEGAAARNLGVETAIGDWIVMLDDDSHPLDAAFIEVLRDADDDIAAIGADILLPGGERESGGLPEVFVGCGVAIRRDAFLAVGGYDGSFGYYAEEYDLCAKLILNGLRIVHDQRFRVRHEKVTAGRDINLILQRLVRNNAWVAQRYAPVDRREAELNEVISRYARISVKEHAAGGFARGVDELLTTLDQQPSHRMSIEQFDRFTGLSHARRTLRDSGMIWPGRPVAMVDEGKNAWAVRQGLTELGAMIVNESEAELLVIGTLSPGPMLDAMERRSGQSTPVCCPWLPRSTTSMTIS